MSSLLTPQLKAALAGVVGESAAIFDPSRLLVYESDALTAYRSAPMGVVLPNSTAEVAAVVRLLSSAGIPMVARGAGTGLSGGAVARGDAVVIGLSRMNRVLSLDGKTGLARVEAGVVNAELSTRAAPHGLYYAPDPSSQTACTLGGNVAENSGGPHCLKYGVTTRYITGLTMVMADGEVAHLGGAHRSDPLDLVGLVVGSEGCFGIVTEIEVQLLPRPRAVRTLLGVFDSPAQAGRAVSAIIARGLLPAALEIIDQATIEAVEASIFAAGYPAGAGAALVIEFDGTEAGLDEDAEHAAMICTEFKAIEVRRAASEEERLALWRGRKKAFGAMGRIAPDLLVQDATVPRSILPDVLLRIAEIGKRYDLRVANVFHAGDGNLHPNILFDRRNAEETARVEKASREIMQACVDAGGTITGEHGVGLDKRGYMTLVHGPAELDAMRRVKAAFDPRGLLNPGKVLPDETSDGEPSAVGGDGDGKGEGSSGTSVPVGSRGAPGSGKGPNLSQGVLEYVPEDLTITVAGDLAWADLVRVTAEQGQWVPALPPMVSVVGTPTPRVSDVLATGASGPLVPLYGRLRDLVLGVRLATPDGRSLRLGGRVVKNVAGFDLLRPVIGAAGRLGTITEATLRLYPIPAAMATIETSLPTNLAPLPITPAALLITTSTSPAAKAEGGSATELAKAADETPPAATLLIHLHGSELQLASEIAELKASLNGSEYMVVHRQEAALNRIIEACQPERAEIRIVAGPSGLQRPELSGALASLMGEEASGVRRMASPLEGREVWGCDTLKPDQARWIGLAQRFAAAGGELRIERGPVALQNALNEVRFESDARAKALGLADAVAATFTGNSVGVG